MIDADRPRPDLRSEPQNILDDFSIHEKNAPITAITMGNVGHKVGLKQSMRSDEKIRTKSINSSVRTFARWLDKVEFRLLVLITR